MKPHTVTGTVGLRMVMPLSTRLPLLVATKIILLWDVPMRTNPYAALAAGERCERPFAPRRRSCL